MVLKARQSVPNNNSGHLHELHIQKIYFATFTLLVTFLHEHTFIIQITSAQRIEIYYKVNENLL